MTIPSSDPASSDLESRDSESREPGNDADHAHSLRAEARRRARRLALHFVVVSCVASWAAHLLWDARAGLSAALGVGLAGMNMLLMQKITRAMTAGGNAAWALALPFKLVALVGVAYVLVSRGVAQPVPLAMGFALLPLTGVFLPRPTSVPGPHVAPRPSRLASHHPRSRRDTMSRRQPVV